MFRCDGKTDCKDSSDEQSCSVVDIDQSYNQFLTPPVSTTTALQRFQILSSVYVHALSSFDPNTGNFEMKFTMKLKWFDGRLQFNNLRSHPKINALKPSEMSKIWFPYFIFENTKKKKLNLIDNKASIKVLKMGKGKLSESYEAENKYVFSGFENYIEYQRFYSEEFECDYFFHWYPFDTQTCYLDVTATSDLQDFISFSVDEFKYLGPPDMTEYMIKKTDMRVLNETLVRVEITIQRRLLSLVLTAFVPTVVLNIIGHMSNYFPEIFFEGLMSLNVTVTLVLTTMFLR